MPAGALMKIRTNQIEGITHSCCRIGQLHTSYLKLVVASKCCNYLHYGSMINVKLQQGYVAVNDRPLFTVGVLKTHI